MPYIIITNGPTGSGKSSLIEKVIDNYNLKTNYTKILIDDIIEMHPRYKSMIDEIIKTICNGNLEICQNLQNSLLNPNPVFLEQFNESYKSTRELKPCLPQTNKNCNGYNDDLLKNAIKNRENIVFETTGKYFVKWIFDMISDIKNQKQNGNEYQIYYAYTILDFCELINRNKTRAVNTTTKYLKNRIHNPAPRLPNVSQSAYTRDVVEIIRNLYTMLNARQGGLYKNINFIVFDNSTYDTTVLYDSSKLLYLQKHEYYMENIFKLINLRQCE
jgi:hypothetical protein